MRSHRIGYFNFINRVLDGLGVDPEPSMRYGKQRVTGSTKQSKPCEVRRSDLR
jgi:hypothetical protein